MVGVKDVGVYASNYRWNVDGCECFVQAASPSSDIVTIKGFGECYVAAGIETLCQFAPLMLQVTFYGKALRRVSVRPQRIFLVLGRSAESFINLKLPSIGEVGYSARGGKAIERVIGGIVVSPLFQLGSRSIALI